MNFPNIIMVLLDGARWDRIEKSPEFLGIIKEGTLLNNVNTAIPYTIGSVNATFSGLYGKDNGIDGYYKMFRLKDSVKIFSEILHDNGYFTACDLLSDKIISKRGFGVFKVSGCILFPKPAANTIPYFIIIFSLNFLIY